MTCVTPSARKDSVQDMSEAIEMPMTTQRRSNLSASQPAGYCEIAPPKT